MKSEWPLLQINIDLDNWLASRSAAKTNNDLVHRIYSRGSMHMVHELIEGAVMMQLMAVIIPA